MDRLQHQLIAAALLALAACGRDASARGAETVVDTIVARDVALQRFRAGVAEVTALTGGARSREALVRAFVAALARADTAALRAMTLSRAEFAWLYYPTAPQGLPPYDLAPGLMWTLLDLHGERGLRRALATLGGRPLRYLGHACDPHVSREGLNSVAGPCTVTVRWDAAEVGEQRLFGLIVERAGAFKFVSLANGLD